MLVNYFRQLWKKRPFGVGKDRFDVQVALKNAAELFNSGDQHRAIEKYREVLEHDPCNLVALNDLSSCLANVGNNEEAKRLFDLALALDDTFLPVLANRAKLLMDQRQSGPAIALLTRAKVTNPFFSAIDGVYQGVLFQHGDAEQATVFMRKTWLASFDQLRMANSYLFSTSYRDVDEKIIAQEHRFWADTLAPPPASAHEPIVQPDHKTDGARIRIGYLSPDFRDHSVRFFFRPLLESHNADRFEVFLYHDAHQQDDQTALMRARAEHFHNVAELTDCDLITLLHSHQLDILVDLAGHTSYNRMHIYQQRLARIQINAIGYPPTTGLSTMDYKLIDRHVWTEDFAHYYTEAPLALPGSFWCYDPMVAVPAPVPPPCTTGKPMVFGCVGNVAKITDRILACWSQILQRLPESRLLIRSVSFQDPDVIDTLHKRLASVGLDMARVDLRKPEGGAAFYASYNDIDIILDTYPFNGGTTTSFAVYMGVPVITWAGNSLVSRMGLSIMRNMGMPDAVVNDAFGYVEAAVRLATNRNALIEFRASARQRLCDSPLGNGQLFAREFEAACEGVLRNHIAATKTASQVEVLPARELTQRAYAVLVRDQPEAARRILGYALQHYPSSASACILETQLASDTIEGSKYVNVLLGKLNTFTVEEQISVRLFLAHHYIRCNEPDTARKVLEPLWGSVVTDVFDQAQLKLYAALLNPSSPTKVTTCEVSIHRILVLYVGDNFELHPDAMMSINSLVLPEGCAIEIKTTSTSNRIVAYREAMGRADVDMVLVLSLHVRITNPFAIVELANGLQHADILSFAGASQWERFDWRADAFGQKVATYMVNNADDGEALELRWIGCDNGQLQNNLAVLDGSFLAFKPSRMQGILLDGELAGAGVLMEEEWVHAAYHEGRRLGVMRTLGVLLSDRSSVDRSFHTEEYLYYISKWGKKVFTTADDLLYANVPVKNPAEGQEICLRICAGL